MSTNVQRQLYKKDYVVLVLNYYIIMTYRQGETKLHMVLTLTPHIAQILRQYQATDTNKGMVRSDMSKPALIFFSLQEYTQ
jgi:hypothetical protein